MTPSGTSAGTPPGAITIHEVRRHRDEIVSSARRNGVHNIWLFGSVARGESFDDSDVDLLVELEDGRSLFDLGAFLMDVQDVLGRRVDVVTTKGVHDRFRARALEEAVPL